VPAKEYPLPGAEVEGRNVEPSESDADSDPDSAASESVSSSMSLARDACAMRDSFGRDLAKVRLALVESLERVLV
jgi:hypothetical protein